MDKLVRYFQERQAAEAALERYYQFAKEQNWDIGGSTGKIRLYSLMLQAMDSHTSPERAYEDFCNVYNTVRKWPGVGRKGSLAPADQVYNAIFQWWRDYFFTSGAYLTTLSYPSEFSDSLVSSLPALHFMKTTPRTTQKYPWMFVSKVLHFVNPGLFPIWDWEIMWGKVMYQGKAAFRDEYEAFCGTHHFTVSEDGSIFLLYYLLWAADYLQRSDLVQDQETFSGSGKAR
jgi:hypothetical protein